jgi:hypothetical protein
VSRNILFCDADLFGSNANTLQLDLLSYIHEALFTFLVEKHDLSKKGKVFSSDGDKSQCFHLLGQLEGATMCVEFALIGKLSEFLLWLFDIWEVGDNSAFQNSSTEL